MPNHLQPVSSGDDPPEVRGGGGEGRGGLGISSDGDDGIGQNSRPKKVPRESHAEFLTLKISRRG